MNYEPFKIFTMYDESQRSVASDNSGSALLPAVCKRRPDGKYEYRGFVIRNHGYYPPDQCVWWEAYNPETGEADYHARTKREIKLLIDEDAARRANGR